MRVSSRAAKFASVIYVSVSVLAGLFLLITPYHAVEAADDCVTEPKGQTLPGQHWFYRMDRGTQQRCWYLRDTDAKAPDAKASTADATGSAAPARTASRRPDTAEPEQASDARAKFPSLPGDTFCRTVGPSSQTHGNCQAGAGLSSHTRY